MPPIDNELSQYTLALGDDALVLGHRLSEWCSRAPELEEDLALANIALDCLGQANLLLTLSAELEGKGRSADDLAFWREAVEFRNVQLVELSSAGDFARMIARQFLVDAFRLPLFSGLSRCRSEKLSGIAAKAEKEITYHLRHSRSWILRLGDGTAESRTRIQSAVDALWPFTFELFAEDPIDNALSATFSIPKRSEMKNAWDQTVRQTLEEATLTVPKAGPRFNDGGGRAGRHTEDLGHMLAEMQIVARSHPGAKW